MNDFNFEIREILFGREEYQAAVQLRRKILRFPLKLDFSSSDLAPDQVDRHFGAFDESRTVIGCLSLTHLTHQVLKMRQVAVAASLQGQGIGIALVTFAELWALKHGYSSFTLNARESAMPFYSRLGYETVGERFVEVSIPHFKMRKGLIPKS